MNATQQLHHHTVRGLHLRSLFVAHPGRGERLTAEACGLDLEYSKNRITDDTIPLLVSLAKVGGLRERIAAMFRGEQVKVTEKRAVLHTVLRAPETARVVVDGVDVVPDQYHPGRASDAGDAGGWSRCTSTASSRRRPSGMSIQLINGASRWARCWLRERPLNSNARMSRRSGTTARPTRSSGATADSRIDVHDYGKRRSP